MVSTRQKLGLGLAVILIAVVLSVTLPRGRETVPSPTSPSIALGLTDEAAALASPDSTFPSQAAGMAAYLRMSPPLDMQKVLPAFESWRQGGNWLIGIVRVRVYPKWAVSKHERQPIRVYVDSQGWVVAYLQKGTPPVSIMVLTEVDKESPNLEAITTTSLEEALKKVVLSAGVDFMPLKEKVRYYDFNYPEAKKMIVLGKAARFTSPGRKTFKISFDPDTTISSESIWAVSTSQGEYKYRRYTTNVVSVYDYWYYGFQAKGSDHLPAPRNSDLRPAPPTNRSREYVFGSKLKGQTVGLLVAFLCKLP